MSPIERAARELCRRDDVDPDSSLGGDGQNFLWMEYAELKVKPVLRAIREPSEAMIQTGYDDGPHSRDTWIAMIDTALAE